MKALSEKELQEMEQLSKDADVKLARAEVRAQYKQKQKLYHLRNLKKRGAQLRELGFTVESFRSISNEIDNEMNDIAEESED